MAIKGVLARSSNMNSFIIIFFISVRWRLPDVYRHKMLCASHPTLLGWFLFLNFSKEKKNIAKLKCLQKIKV